MSVVISVVIQVKILVVIGPTSSFPASQKAIFLGSYQNIFSAYPQIIIFSGGNSEKNVAKRDTSGPCCE